MARSGIIEGEKEMAFFDKVSGTLAARGRDVADKAKELAELNRLNGQIHAQRSKADKIYMEIGKIVYESRADWEKIDVSARLELLDSIGSEIAGLEKEVLKVRGVQLCEKCGTEIGREASFCPKCGTVVKAAPGESVGMQNSEAVYGSAGTRTTVPSCPGCGREVGQEAVLCPFCGIRLKHTD